MKSKQLLMTALVGIAMMATPITALAGDHGRDFNGRAAHESRGSGRMIASPRAFGFGSGVATTVRPLPVAPTTRFTGPPIAVVPPSTRYMGPPVVGGQVVPPSTRYMGPPVAGGTFLPVGHHYGWNHERGWEKHKWNHRAGLICDDDGDDCHRAELNCDEDGDDCQSYGNSGYYAAPAYSAAAPYYGTQGYGYAGGSCARAQRIMRVYNRDRYTGHPAAAEALLRNNQWVLNSGCAGVSPYGGGLLSGFAGVPAYQNYGGYNNYNNGGLLGGLLGGSAYQNYGGYNNYNNGGYNQGYGYNQPYGNGATSMLAPLLQQFVH